MDPIDRLEGDTPLHKAVRFTNSLTRQEWEAGSSMVDLLLDAGADPRSVILPRPPAKFCQLTTPRLRNKAKLKPMELVDPRNTELRSLLQKAEFTMTAGDDVVNRDAEEEDEGPTGSASDSDSD